MQYKVGETYTYDGTIQLYSRGYHFCDTPLAVLLHYPPDKSRYCIVEALDEPLHEAGNHEFCTSKIKILREITFKELLQADPTIMTILHEPNGVVHTEASYRSVISQSDLSVAATTGECSVAIAEDGTSIAVSTGYDGIAIAKQKWSISAVTSAHNTVVAKSDYSIAASTGYASHIAALGKNSVAVSIGNMSLFSSSLSVNDIGSLAVSWDGTGAKGVIGSWILLSEYDEKAEVIKDAKLFKVDGKVIKPNTYYTLKDDKVIELSKKPCIEDYYC